MQRPLCRCRLIKLIKLCSLRAPLQITPRRYSVASKCLVYSFLQAGQEHPKRTVLKDSMKSVGLRRKFRLWQTRWKTFWGQEHRQKALFWLEAKASPRICSRRCCNFRCVPLWDSCAILRLPWLGQGEGREEPNAHGSLEHQHVVTPSWTRHDTFMNVWAMSKGGMS